MTRTVLITGASSGIGAATAEYLRTRGFRVYGTSRNARPDDSGENPIRWLTVDVCDEDSVRAAVERVVAQTGRLDALVCNAGAGIFGSVEEVPVATALQQFDVNFFGVLRSLRAAIPRMREARSGRIVVVGSLAGRAAIPFQAHYSASKSAVDGLVQGLYNELHPYGVSVSLVEPGDIDTAFNDRTTWARADASPYGDRIRRCEQVIRENLPRSPGPEIVARVIHRALTARRPRVRYGAGPFSRLLPLGRRVLPDRLLLAVVRSVHRV